MFKLLFLSGASTMQGHSQGVLKLLLSDVSAIRLQSIVSDSVKQWWIEFTLFCYNVV